MQNFIATSPFPELELLCFFSLSQTGWAMAFMIWQLLSVSVHSLQRSAQNMPVLVRELRLWEMGWRLTLQTECNRIYFYPLLSAHYLLLRDGHDIFDFFKTFLLNDVSPPALAV